MLILARTIAKVRQEQGTHPVEVNEGGEVEGGKLGLVEGQGQPPEILCKSWR